MQTIRSNILFLSLIGIIPGNAYLAPVLLPVLGLPSSWNWDKDPIDARLDATILDASPITHLSKDDPPIFLIQSAAAATPGNIHHPNIGKHLKEAADKPGVACISKLDSDYESTIAANINMVTFLESCLR